MEHGTGMGEGPGWVRECEGWVWSSPSMKSERESPPRRERRGGWCARRRWAGQSARARPDPRPERRFGHVWLWPTSRESSRNGVLRSRVCSTRRCGTGSRGAVEVRPCVGARTVRNVAKIARLAHSLVHSRAERLRRRRHVIKRPTSSAARSAAKTQVHMYLRFCYSCSVTAPSKAAPSAWSHALTRNGMGVRVRGERPCFVCVPTFRRSEPVRTEHTAPSQRAVQWDRGHHDTITP